MSARPREVDLGPIYLPVGEELPLAAWTREPGEARVADIARFDQLMGRRGRPTTDGSAGQHAQDSDWPWVPELADAARIDWADCEANSLESEIERLWISEGASGIREVRLGLRREVLPDTTVRLLRQETSLHVDIACGRPVLASWLRARAQAIATELADRLGRDVTVRVRDSIDGLVTLRVDARGGWQ